MALKSAYNFRNELELKGDKVNASLQGVRILFFIPQANAQTNGVLASQVVGLARYCVTLGAECLVFHHAKGEVQDCVELEKGIRFLSLSGERPKTNIFNVVRGIEGIVEAYHRQLVEFRPTHIYTRSYAMCLGILRLAKETGAKTVYSMRGPDVYEQLRYGRLKDRVVAFFMERLVRKAVMSCDSFTSMTQAAVDWIKQKYGRDGVAFPCCVTESFFLGCDLNRRKEMRARCGFAEGHKVVAWCGSFVYWQMLDDVITLLKGMANVDASIRILFLVSDVVQMKKLCDKHGLDESLYCMKQVKSYEVPSYLNACDVGLDCLALDDFKSSICCPIKVGEYLAVGLPILITRTMGDIPSLVDKYGIGAILEDSLDPHDAVDKMNHLLTISREKVQGAARAFFAWEANRENVERLFCK